MKGIELPQGIKEDLFKPSFAVCWPRVSSWVGSSELDAKCAERVWENLEAASGENLWSSVGGRDTVATTRNDCFDCCASEGAMAGQADKLGMIARGTGRRRKFRFSSPPSY